MFWGRQGRALGVCLTCLCNFLSHWSGHILQPLHIFLWESVLGWLSGQTLSLTSRNSDWSTCGKHTLKWLAWCFCAVLGDSRLSRWWGEALAIRGEFGRQNFNKNDQVCERVKRCIHDFANTHLHNMTMRLLKPSTHTCSTWLTDGVSGKCDTFDWSLGNRDDTCTIVYMTPCVSVMDVYIANTTCTHEAKALCMTITWSQT